MSNTRVIKKYPNRRLYDTEESRYITLSDVKDLVMHKVDFTVIDKRSGEDITRTILLQVISEQEQHGDAIMSEEFLAQIIRAYGAGLPDLITRCLEQSMDFITRQQQFLQDQMTSVAGSNPLDAMAELTQKNLARMQTFHKEMLDGLLPENSGSDDEEAAAPGNQSRAG